MKLSKTKLASVIVLAVAIVSLVFLVQDIYNLQKLYELYYARLNVSRSPTHGEYMLFMGLLNELRAKITLRVVAVVLVLTATVFALLILNKRKIFKGKYAVVTLTLSLLLVGFFQVRTVNARSTTTLAHYYAGVQLTVPQNHSSDLASVTGCITPSPADFSQYFVSYFIAIRSEGISEGDFLV